MSAEPLATGQPSEATSPHSRNQGHLGLALVTADLCEPEHSAVPWFEPEP
jgi:hypothetical protein